VPAKNTLTDVFRHLNLKPVHPVTCWLWTAGVSSKGIPYISVGGKKIIAYRAAYKCVHPDWDIDNSREVIRHKCKDALGRHVDNPLCCRPDHLLPGTHEQNMLDAMLHGRKGLTVDVIRDIIDISNRFPEWTQKQVADRVAYKHKINVSRQAVTDLLSGARHKELRDALDARDRELTESGVIKDG